MCTSPFTKCNRLWSGSHFLLKHITSLFVASCVRARARVSVQACECVRTWCQWVSLCQCCSLVEAERRVSSTAAHGRLSLVEVNESTSAPERDVHDSEVRAEDASVCLVPACKRCTTGKYLLGFLERRVPNVCATVFSC